MALSLAAMMILAFIGAILAVTAFYLGCKFLHHRAPREKIDKTVMG